MKNNNDNRLGKGSRLDLRAYSIKLIILLGSLLSFEVDAYEVAPVKDGVSIQGKVHLGNSKPLVKRFPIFKDHKICGKGHRDIPLVQVNGEGLLDTVVYLVNVPKGKPFRSWSKKITINQSGCRFIPHLSVMANGGEIEVINSDATLHNIHAYELVGANHFSNFTVSQPQRGDIVTKEVTVRRGMGMRVNCDAHNFMRGFVFLARNPYFAIVESDGMYSIDDIPPGTYVVRTWHGTLGERTRTITVKPNSVGTVDFYY